MLKKMIMILVILSVMFSPGAVMAAESPANDYFAEITTKMGRGLGNIIQSPIELPCGIVDESAVRPYVSIITGTLKGVFKLGRRVLVGAGEIATFMVPSEGTIEPVCSDHHTVL